ncbi:uncharacterized protein LOC144425803 [Styela clava]
MAVRRSRRSRILHRIRISFQCQTPEQKTLFLDIWGGRFILLGILTVIVGFTIAVGSFIEPDYIGYIVIAGGSLLCIFGYILRYKGNAMRTRNHIAPSINTVTGPVASETPPPYNPEWTTARTGATVRGDIYNNNFLQTSSLNIAPSAAQYNRPPSAAPPSYEQAVYSLNGNI